MNEKITNALADLDEETVMALVQEGISAGIDPSALLTACQEGMNLVGERYQAGDYFLSELIMAGEIFKQIMKELPVGVDAASNSKKGKIVFGTVKGDIHDLGKDLVVGMLRGAGYEVTDLGIDVPVERFIQAVNDTGAKIVGLSGLLTTAFDSMKATVQALEVAGLRPGVRVMIGGGPVTEAVLSYSGADALGRNPQDAVNFANQWSAGKDAAYG